MHQMDRMEECDGGEASSLATGSASLDLTSMLKNKYLGGKRSSPQEKPEQRRVTEKEKKMYKCPQCDFISQNEIFISEHMTKAHAGQPNCPFCFVGFKDS